jgi:hypothetical protein
MHGQFNMSSYKRQNRSYYRSNYPTKVTISWSQQYSAYALKFCDTHHYQEMTPIMNFIKSNPYGDYTYDPDNKIWYFAEKYLQQVRTLVDAFGSSIFETDFHEKPPLNYSFSSKTISVETYLQNFRDLTGEDIKNLDYNSAKRIYHRVCMKFHPDRNPDFASTMRSINEIWAELEKLHFKTRSQIVYDMP